MVYLRTYTDVFARPQRLLHIAPEPGISNVLSRIATLDYITGDLSSSLAQMRIDVTALPFSDASFDAAICSHVLEHVIDDGAAISELFRVVSPGGWAWLDSPVERGRATTFEDPQITSPDDRERVFGQWDHVRIYGTDLYDRWLAAGFAVETVDITDSGQPGPRLGLPVEPARVCRKPRS
jgi:SAM-dependent methyltransferase